MVITYATQPSEFNANIEWSSVYQTARPYDPYLIPIPICMGRRKTGELPSPALNNAELLKVCLMYARYLCHILFKKMFVRKLLKLYIVEVNSEFYTAAVCFKMLDSMTAYKCIVHRLYFLLIHCLILFLDPQFLSFNTPSSHETLRCIET